MDPSLTSEFDNLISKCDFVAALTTQENYLQSEEFLAHKAAEELEHNSNIKRAVIRRAIDYFNNPRDSDTYYAEIVLFSPTELADFIALWTNKGYEAVQEGNNLRIRGYEAA